MRKQVWPINCMKRCVNLLAIEKIKNKTTIKGNFILSRLSKNEQSSNTNALKNVGQWELSPIPGGNTDCYNHQENCHYPIHVKMLTLDVAMPCFSNL